ncbi:unnamed protein product [Spodoptera exigua]|nr:unnamed protein product [Spodoptera exigua]
MKVLVFVSDLCIVPIETSPLTYAIGGSLVMVENHPSIALASLWWRHHQQSCHSYCRPLFTCSGDNVKSWRIRIDSSFTNTWGQVHLINRYIAYTVPESWTISSVSCTLSPPLFPTMKRTLAP